VGALSSQSGRIICSPEQKALADCQLLTDSRVLG
jgi:hypothetical protein